MKAKPLGSSSKHVSKTQWFEKEEFDSRDVMDKEWQNNNTSSSGRGGHPQSNKSIIIYANLDGPAPADDITHQSLSGQHLQQLDEHPSISQVHVQIRDPTRHARQVWVHPFGEGLLLHGLSLICRRTTKTFKALNLTCDRWSSELQ